MTDKKGYFEASSPGQEPPPGRFEALLRLLTRLQRFSWDIGGIFLVALSLMTLLAILLPSLTGGLLAWWVRVLRIWFGWGSLWAVVGLALAGLGMLRRRTHEASNLDWGRLFLFEAAAFASMTWLSIMGGTSLPRADAGLDGGRVGWGLAELLRVALEPIGMDGTAWRALLVGLLMGLFLIGGFGLLGPLLAWARQGACQAARKEAGEVGPGPAVSEAPLQSTETALESSQEARKKRAPLPPEFRKSLQAPEMARASGNIPPRDEQLPPLDLLIYEQYSRPDERNINLTAGMIEKTLAEFGIPAKVIGYQKGPTVTQFAIEPGFLEKEKVGTEGDPSRQKVRVAQILSLERDLALALSAERLRIEAPVPGRPYLGIEVPNTRSSAVRLRPILENEIFYRVNSPLTIALGRDVSGAPVVADLGRMPHLLIAGTTGSGKSVCIAAITTCLVMNNFPKDLRLVMIDPKMVELVRFNGLPHLYGKVETDIERIMTVLRWTVAEMDRRYKVLEASHSRNIDSHNRKARYRKGEETLPHIVMLIDELADLMLSMPDQTEHNLVRLAQMARATGIHLVVATQRPSTEVVTGLIKANFPSRISFTVASSVDSRVILDSSGAEALLGKGDMLFVPPESSSPLRVQGVMVVDQEVENVVRFWQNAGAGLTEAAIAPWEELLEKEQILADRDDLVEKAIQLVRETRRANASLLQRRLRIGYPRAARLIDELEELGVIGPSTGGGRDREVLIEEEGEQNDF